MGQRRGLVDHQFNGHKSSQQVLTSHCLYGTLCYCMPAKNTSPDSRVGYVHRVVGHEWDGPQSGRGCAPHAMPREGDGYRCVPMMDGSDHSRHALAHRGSEMGGLGP